MKDIVLSHIETTTVRKEIVITKEIYNAILEFYNAGPYGNTSIEEISFENFYQIVIGNKEEWTGDHYIQVEYREYETGGYHSGVDYYSGESYTDYVESGFYTKHDTLLKFIRKFLEKNFDKLSEILSIEVITKERKINTEKKNLTLSVPDRVAKYE